MARLLVADDQPEWLDLLSLWLSNRGHEVIRASRGADVIPLAEKTPPDCFVLDYDLGDRKGSELCAAIRAHATLKSVPAIMLTSMAGEMLRVFTEGAPDHFIVKSQHPDELLLVLDEILQRPAGS